MLFNLGVGVGLDSAILGQEDRVVVLCVYRAYLEQAPLACRLQAEYLGHAQLSYELEAHELVAAPGDRCLFPVQDDGVALTLDNRVSRPDFQVAGEFAELAELLELALNLAFPCFKDVLHEAVLLEHGHLRSTWGIDV